MIPHLTTIPRCDTHPWSLLTGDGECPQCTREAEMARVKTAAELAEAARLQAQTRAYRGRRRMTEAEAVRIARSA